MCFLKVVIYVYVGDEKCALPKNGFIVGLILLYFLPDKKNPPKYHLPS